GLAQTSSGPRAEECAAAVLDTVPAVMDALRAATRQHVGEQMSVPQFRCLHFVSREPRCSISDVAAFLGVTLPTASAMVDRLARAAGTSTPNQPSNPPSRSRATARYTPRCACRSVAGAGAIESE